MTHPTNAWVTHAESGTQNALDRYAAARAEGRSVVVRPARAYDGWDLVRAHLVGLSGRPLLATSLSHLAADDETCEGAGDRDEPVLAFHTSGSTGSPKCVVYAGATAAAHAAMVASTVALDPARRYLALPPCGFAFGLSIVNSHLHAEVPVHFVSTGAGAQALRTALERLTAIDTVYLLPQQASLLLACADHLPALATVILAGGRLSGATATAIAERFPGLELVNMYGQAELGPRVSLWRGQATEFREGLLGQAVPGVELELGPADERGRRELLVCSAYAMQYLLRAPYVDLLDGPAPGTPHPTGDLVAREGADLVHRGRADGIANVAGTRLDLNELSAQVERAVPTLGVRIGTRTSRVSGDDILVIQVVPPGGVDAAPYTAPDVRRALDPVLGPLVSLLDVRLVDHLEVGEAGK